MTAREPASPRAVGLIALFGVLAAVLFADGVGGIAITGATLLLLATVLLAVHPHRPAHDWLAVGALLTSMVFAVRSSPWVLIPCGAALIVLLTVWVVLPRQTGIFNVSWPMIGPLVRQSAAEAVRSPQWAVDGASRVVKRTGHDYVVGWLRGIALALPLFFGLFLLLAWADPVFESVVRPSFSPLSAGTTLVTAIAATLVALVLTRLARRSSSKGVVASKRSRLRNHEAVIVLSSVAGLFAAFVAVQLVTSRGGGLDRLAAEGISVADYARSGYFQLLAVVFISSVVIMVVDGFGSAKSSTRLTERALSVVILLLTMTILVVAVNRLMLYVDTYGLTMLRLACFVAAAWMAALLLILGFWVLGFGRRRNWLIGALGLSLVVTSLAFAAINPEGLVVQHNIERTTQKPTDLAYLASLSTDAVPELVDSLDELAPRNAQLVLEELCAPAAASSWSRWTLSEAAARATLSGRCRSATGMPEFRDIDPSVFTGTVNV